ncbi:hypothetical protein HX881_20380 [Pseudomonas gingeri]|uniref:Prevent-host-death family protein n=1 Tax=Pseudomonas gingeri TaxID=117681 RepID=A0A7Y7Y527_9PSED|nr:MULTISPECIES: hypothetical protein [Pseudomonas]NVZ27921.1 hypothetical protein [Pseudomonas gingeri]NVZ65321.1 hypothetical protein [Pseudomonas gingeri]NVZ74084.1 hypothetical protein [Pseudomonas gingeri]NWA05909.1 hypothetical protein [Pseudomonas gingeri]NWC17736.1 hypothetical protein [Pseudomonas gingeri]
MCQVKYDMPDAQTSLEFILEQVICGAEVIITRYGLEVARITAVQGPRKNTAAVLPLPPQASWVPYAS